MKRIIVSLLEKWGCSHSWGILNTTRTFTHKGDELPSRIDQVVVCKKCGKITKIKL